jgi:hypothetical protein
MTEVSGFPFAGLSFTRGHHTTSSQRDEEKKYFNYPDNALLLHI